MNGRPGDYPLTDMLVHKLTVFSPEADSLIKEIIALGGQHDLETKFNLLSPPPLEQFMAELKLMLAGIKEQAKERGWEVDEKK